MRRRFRWVPAARSSFAGFRFPPDVIMLAVRWYLRYGLSYRDVEELLAEQGITRTSSWLVHTLRVHGQRAASHAGQDSDSG
jgi:transposase-like protein